MKKIIRIFCAFLVISALFSVSASALTYHTVEKGDTLWRIAVKYEVGLSELKSVNRDIKNYDLIYPGQKITIPDRDADEEKFEKEVIRLVNIERRKNGLSDLKYNWELSRVAGYKSEDMNKRNYFSHTSPTYGTPFEMIRNFGITYRSAGENIAKGQKTPEAVVKAWMNSSGHRANILSKSFTEIGVGYVADGNIWTQLFIGR